MEEQLRQLIEQAKATNNTMLVEQLTQTLNAYIAQQKQQEDIKLKSQENINQEENTIQEVKKETVIQDNKTEEDDKKKKTSEEDIKKVVSGEVSRLITTNTNNHILESAYMQMSSSAKNPKLRIELNKILVTLALDDVMNQKNGAIKISSLLEQYEEPEDIEDIQQFLNDIAGIGQVGMQTKDTVLSAFSNTDERKEMFDKYYDTEYTNLSKSVDLTSMELDEISSKDIKDTNDLDEIEMRYQSILQKLEKLLDETANKVDNRRTQELSNTIKYVKEQIKSIQAYKTSLKDIENYANAAFNSL